MKYFCIINTKSLKNCVSIHDNALSHLHENVNKFITHSSVDVHLGLTRFLQPLDISINKPIKHFLKQEYTNRRIKGMTKLSNPLNSNNALKEELISIIKEI